MSKGVVLSVLASVLFAVMYYFTSLLTPLSGLEIFGWRMLLTVPCMTVFMLVSGEWRRVWELLRMLAAKPRLIGGVLVSSALLGVQLWLFMWAPLNGRSLDVSVGYFLLPLAMVLVGRLFYGERLRPLQTLAVVCALLGVAHELWLTRAFSWVTLLAAVGYPPYFMLRRWMRLDALSGFILEMLILTPVAIWLIISAGLPDVFIQAPQLWWLLPGLGLLSALAFGAMMAASRLLPLGLFGILSYVEPVLLFAVSVLVLGEHFNPAQLWTYLPIWLAVLLVGWDSARLLRRQARQGL